MNPLIGILFGLGAAFSQSLSYIFSRVFVARFSQSAITLLVSSHIIMGAFSLLALAVFSVDSMPLLQSYLWWLLGTAFFYLSAQVCLFLALRRSDASRVSPLLGIKILFLAIITVPLLGETFSGTQIGAVLLCVGAALLLSWSRGRMGRQSLLWVMLTCLGYSLSDVCVKHVIDQFLYLGLFHGSVVSVSLCYALCGLIGLGFMPFVPRLSREIWSVAFPFALTWFVAMLFLFASFGSIGIVFGNIVQATRGVISVLLGVLVGAAGFVHLEEKMTPKVFIKKLSAALLMVGAIALYYTG